MNTRFRFAIRSITHSLNHSIPSSRGLELLRLFERLLDRADHKESLFGHVVVLAFYDLLEPADGVLNLDELAFQARELHHDEEGLREEELDLPRPRHGDLVFVGELINAQDGDDVLEVFVFLQDRLTARATL